MRSREAPAPVSPGSSDSSKRESVMAESVNSDPDRAQSGVATGPQRSGCWCIRCRFVAFLRVRMAWQMKEIGNSDPMHQIA